MAQSADTPRIRLFVEGALTTNGLIALSAAQCHYATNVMRLAVGDHIAVFNGAVFCELPLGGQCLQSCGRHRANAEATRTVFARERHS